MYISFTEKIIPDKIIDRNIPRKSFIGITLISTDHQHAERVGKALVGYSGQQIIDKLCNCLLSDDERALDVSFFVAYNTLLTRSDFYKRTEIAKVMQFLYIEDKIVREKNLIIKTLEFSESDGGILYAHYSPNGNISTLIAPYFYKKYQRLPFVLHDIKRGRIIASNGYTMHFTDTELNYNLLNNADQQQFDSLWKRCYREILLKEKRLNKLAPKNMNAKYLRSTK